jgi:hypothetical protein
VVQRLYIWSKLIPMESTINKLPKAQTQSYKNLRLKKEDISKIQIALLTLKNREVLKYNVSFESTPPAKRKVNILYFDLVETRIYSHIYNATLKTKDCGGESVDILRLVSSLIHIDNPLCVHEV